MSAFYRHQVYRGATLVATPTLIAGYDMARQSQSVLYPRSQSYGGQQFQPRDAGLRRGRLEFLCTGPSAQAIANALDASFCTGAVHTIVTPSGGDGVIYVNGNWTLDGEARVTLLEDRRSWLVAVDVQEV